MKKNKADYRIQEILKTSFSLIPYFISSKIKCTEFQFMDFFNGNKINTFSVVRQVLGYNKLICHFNLSIMVSHLCIDIFDDIKSVL